MEINIQRIIQDGLDMERNFLEHVELQQTQKLEKFSHVALKKLLQTFYQCEGGPRYLASLLNAILTQEKVTFYLDFKVMTRLVKDDVNIQFKELSPFIFKMFIEKITRGGFVKHLGGEDGQIPHVYTLMHPDILKYFYRTMGKEAIAEQRSYVVQYVKGLKEFQRPNNDGDNEMNLKRFVDDMKRGMEDSRDNRKMTFRVPETQEGKENLRQSHDDGPPALPKEIMKKDHLSSHVSKGRKNLDELEKLLNQENMKLSLLKERARVAESFRLSNSEDSASLKTAVHYATEAKQQERKVMDIELEFLKIKEMRVSENSTITATKGSSKTETPSLPPSSHSL